MLPLLAAALLLCARPLPAVALGVARGAGLRALRGSGGGSDSWAREQPGAGSPSQYRQTLRNFHNVQYSGEFRIGGQPVSGIFDTGSFELLVRSTRCQACEHPTPPYDRNRSTTYVKNGTEAEHVFGSGPCTSLKGYETVSVGPMSSRGQAFWEIMKHDIQALDTAKFAAIVGIGPNFGYGSEDQTLLMSFGVTEFSICLQRPSGADGFLTWGSDRHSSAATRADGFYARAEVIGKHHWVTPLHDVSFLPASEAGGKAPGKPNPCGGTGCAAIIDSGTSLIAAPAEALAALSEQIEPIMEDCSNLHKLPVLRFMINGTEFTLPPQAYVMKVTGSIIQTDSMWEMLFFKPKARRVDMCMPAFMQIDMRSQHGPVWILGMPFFRYYHTTFDRKGKSMHFARAGKGCAPQPFRRGGGEGDALLDVGAGDEGPLEVEVHSLVPPTLSGMIDLSGGPEIML